MYIYFLKYLRIKKKYDRYTISQYICENVLTFIKRHLQYEEYTDQYLIVNIVRLIAVINVNLF